MIWWRRRPTEPPATPAEALDEQLSAYIDGDLSEAGATAIEARLAAEPELRDALDGMQQIRDLLGDLGEAAAPRAFTLEAPPARAGLPRMELFARLGAAVSALLLAAVLVGDSVTTSGVGVESASIAQPATLQAAPAAAPEERATTEQQATAETESADAESAATPEVATLAAPAPATTAAAADDTRAAPAPATAPTPLQPQTNDGAAATEEPAPTAEQTQAYDLPQPGASDPGGAALDAAQIALLVLLALFATVAVWQFVRRTR